MAYSYREQLEIVKMISLGEGEKKTIDCPFCGGRRKFSLYKQDGRVLWNCFKASCSAKGSYQGQRSVAAIKSKLSGTVLAQPERKVTPIPSFTTSVFNCPEAIDYLESNNCMDAVRKGFIKVRYAPGEKRVLLYSNDYCGAVGRSLVGHAAKWWTYGDVSGGFRIGEGEVAVFVEDVPSACSVSRLPGYVGVALLGTSLGKVSPTSSTHSQIVVLDNDASSKAMSIAKQLGSGTTIRLTKTDLKLLSVEDLRNILEFNPVAVM